MEPSVSDYHPAVTCEKCRSKKLKCIAPVRLHFQPHARCEKCGHEELEVITFMRTYPAMERHEARKAAKATGV
jgi:rRNA maturation endonuclease Nob1